VYGSCDGRDATWGNNCSVTLLVADLDGGMSADRPCNVFLGGRRKSKVSTYTHTNLPRQSPSRYKGPIVLLYMSALEVPKILACFTHAGTGRGNIDESKAQQSEAFKTEI
jgi:hypothetical protein